MKMRGCSSTSIYPFMAWYSSIVLSDYRRSSGLDIEFIDHLYPGLGTTRNYSATANLHKSPQHPLSLFQPDVSSPAVPWQRFLQLQALNPSLNGGSFQLPLFFCHFSSYPRVQNWVGCPNCLPYNPFARTV
jgi:hypothetical protein